MSKRVEVERFAREVRRNDALREQLESYGSDRNAVVRFANSQGYDFTIDDLNAMVSTGELSDSQLENIAGGLRVAGGDDDLDDLEVERNK